MIETILTICALTMVSPYYDCSEKWNIIVWDETHEYIPGTERAIGTALYTKPFGKEIELVSYHQNATGKHDYMMKGGGVLWHEILHMYCECDWHEYWDVKEDDNPRKKSQVNKPILSIPDEIKPFIKKEYHEK